MNKDLFRKRIKKLLQEMKRRGSESIAIIESTPRRQISRDTFHRYRSDSNFYYLSGSHLEESLLVVSTRENRPVLIAPPADPVKELWEGAGESPATVARRIGANLILSNQKTHELKHYLKGAETVFHGDSSIEKTSWLHCLLEAPAHLRFGQPKSLTHIDPIMEKLRLYKDTTEVKQISHAIEITKTALESAFPLMRPGVSEHEVAARIEYEMHKNGAGTAFQTIVATGGSAAVLHYDPIERAISGTLKAQKIRKGETILIDCGADWRMYSGDITRCFPSEEQFTGPYAEIYDVVLEAQLAAIKKVKPGVTVPIVYNAAAKVITEGLVSLGILKGKVSTLMNKESHKKYFPHRIGHLLGLDTHDIGRMRAEDDFKIEKGMVVTIEPGLYFAKKVRRIPPGGIRIEDDILVTATGSKNLSRSIPKTRDEVEDWKLSK